MGDCCSRCPPFVRLLTVDEQTHFYAVRGKRAPIWSQYGLFRGAFIIPKTRLYDTHESATKALEVKCRNVYNIWSN